MSVRSLLESEGIEVFVQGENHRALEGGLLAAIIELRVMVRFKDLEDARELLEELDYAEHLPPESVEPDPNDRSLQEFQKRELTPIDTTRDPAKAALFALIVPFGGGHFYAGRRGSAAVLAVIQCLNVLFWLQGWGVLKMALAVVAFDAIFSGLRIRRDRERAQLRD
jgi:hypothetical protein